MIWDLLRRVGITRKITRRHLSEFVKSYASSGRTLDVGCGTGRYAMYFPNRIGIDVQPGPAVDVTADVHDLHMFKDGEFDRVLCTEVLEHLHTPNQALSEMHRVLKDGGMLILTTRFVYPIHGVSGDYYRFTRLGLEHLLRDFETTEIRAEADTLGTIAVLLQRVGFQCETLGLKPLRLFWLLLAKLVNSLSFVITAEWGDVGHKSKVDSIMASGYYVACRKAPEGRA